MEPSVVMIPTPGILGAMTLADWVKAERDRRGWTQQELADKAGIDRVEVNALERGRNKGSSARIRGGLAKAFGIPLAAVGGAAPKGARVEYESDVALHASALGLHRDFTEASEDCELRYGKWLAKHPGAMDAVRSMDLGLVFDRLDGDILFKLAEAWALGQEREALERAREKK